MASVNLTNERPFETTPLDKCLASVRVKSSMIDGICATKINMEGKAKRIFLALSPDRFHLFVTKEKLKNGKIPSDPYNESKTLKKLFQEKFKNCQGTGEESGLNIDDMSGNTIDIATIERIQMGQATMQFEHHRFANMKRSSTSSTASALMESQHPELSFSIIYSGERSLALIAHTKEDRDDIIYSLEGLRKAYSKHKTNFGKDVLLMRHIWLDVDKDRSCFISLSEVKTLMNRINFYMEKKKIEDKYITMGKKIGLDKQGRRRGLDFKQCVLFFHNVKRDTWTQKPIIRIWNDLVGESEKKMSARKFLETFLHEKQRERAATINTVKDIFFRVNRMEIADLASNIDGGDKYIDINHLEEYLNSRENDIFDPEKEKINPEDMNEPLSHYWINSSHNTYLDGDQLKSQSTVEMYLRALYRGCRCVEIDVWDGPKGPTVTHGGTLTSKIPFTDIIHIINSFLIHNPNSFPIIISLENHCSLDYQTVMAKELEEVFGDRLFIPTTTELFNVLPSPNSLRGKVVLKGHRSDVTEDDFEGSDVGTDDGEDLHLLREKTRTRVNICQALSKLTLFHGSKTKAYWKSLQFGPYRMHSHNDSAVGKLCANRKDLVIYNQSNMSRIYPDFTRFRSDNYSPLIAWYCGCQMIALNFQTSDPYLLLNDGRFRTNGGCGYVLKPQSMLQKQFVDSYMEHTSLKVEVLSAARLPKPKGQRRGECIDPYVTVTLWDVNSKDRKEIKKTYKTNTVRNNGFCPIFNSEQSKFHFEVQRQDIAMLQFMVWDEDYTSNDDFIGSAAIPISCIRNGIRSVQIFNAQNTCSGVFDVANILVDVEVEHTEITV